MDAKQWIHHCFLSPCLSHWSRPGSLDIKAFSLCKRQRCHHLLWAGLDPNTQIDSKSGTLNHSTEKNSNKQTICALGWRTRSLQREKPKGDSRQTDRQEGRQAGRQTASQQGQFLMAVWVTGAKMKRTGQDDGQSWSQSSVQGGEVGHHVLLSLCENAKPAAMAIFSPEKMAFSNSLQQFLEVLSHA